MSLRGMLCTVTGGTGMIGREVCRQLVDLGAEVRSVSLDRTPKNPVEGVEYWQVDLCDTRDAQEVVGCSNMVFHVAGMKGGGELTRNRPASFFVPLLQMNTNVLRCAFELRTRCVYVSSIGAYGGDDGSWGGDFDDEYLDIEEQMSFMPMDFYPGWAKRMGELQCEAYYREHGYDVAIVRPSNVYGIGDRFGPGAMVIPALIRKSAEAEPGGEVEVLGDGSAVRDFVHARDVARGIIRACRYGTNGFVNLGGGPENAVSIGDLSYMLHKITGRKYKFAGGKPTFSRRVLKIEKAKKLLGWEPEIPLCEGLQEVWDWYQAGEREERVDYFE